jgi:hypothetical protein
VLPFSAGVAELQEALFQRQACQKDGKQILDRPSLQMLQLLKSAAKRLKLAEPKRACGSVKSVIHDNLSSGLCTG